MSSVANHSFYYSVGKGLYGFGCNSNGQLGNGSSSDINVPTLVMESKENIKRICAGYSHSVILKENGDVFVMGSSSDGRLGIGDINEDKKRPILLMKDVRDIACGGQSTLLLDNNFNLFACGWNSNGQLGFKGNSNKTEPTLLMKDEEIKSIHAGYAHTMIYKNNGDLLVFGSNSNGQLGTGANANNYENEKPTLLLNDKNIKSISLGRDHSMFLKNNGDAYIFGSVAVKGTQHHTPFLLSSGVKQICCGGYFSVLLKENGELHGIGANSNHQIDNTGIQTHESLAFMYKDPQISTFACGYYHVLILKKNGDLVSFGSNSNGQLGVYQPNHKMTFNLVINDPSISMLMGEDSRHVWTPETHLFFGLAFKKSIFGLLMVLKKYHKLHKIKIPKFVLFEIIKLVV